MSDKTFTTGEVSGMTGISVRTMQAHISEHKVYFSPEAQKPQKGRRYTAQDVDTLLKIKRAKEQRIPADMLNQILSGEVEMPLANLYQDLDVKQMAATAAENIERAAVILGKYDEIVKQNQQTMGRLWHENQDLKTKVQLLEKTVSQIRWWQLLLMKSDPAAYNPWYVKGEDYHPEMRPDELQPTTTNAEKKPGFFGKLLS